MATEKIRSDMTGMPYKIGRSDNSGSVVGDMNRPDPARTGGQVQNVGSMATCNIEYIRQSIQNPDGQDFDGVLSTDIKNPMWRIPSSPSDARKKLQATNAYSDVPAAVGDMYWWQEAGARR